MNLLNANLKEANEKLEDILVSGRYGYRKVKGSYGVLENSYIVNNISLDSAISLGEKFNQDSIVYGEVVGGDNDEIYMKFKRFTLIYGNNTSSQGFSN